VLTVRDIEDFIKRLGNHHSRASLQHEVAHVRESALWHAYRWTPYRCRLAHRHPSGVPP
jgi:hypothetical protein